MPTIHIAAAREDIANVVLMPGDPYRAKMIAEKFLVDAKLVNEIRGAYCYTGHTKNGKRISVMSSGMGMPSIGIYSHELFTGYDVDMIIRIGTCGAYQEQIKLNDIIVAEGACTDSNWMAQYHLDGTYSALADFELLLACHEEAVLKKKRAHFGNVLSADVFYDHNKDAWKKWAALGILGVEMESYALYAEAADNKKKALGIFTVSNSFLEKEELSAERRQNGLIDMIELALAVAERYAK